MKYQALSTISMLLYVIIFATELTSFSGSADAQLVPDGTLGAERSQVINSGLRDRIEGGAIRGRNVFHSFTEFNIGNGREVYFISPLSINSIFVRVTGNNPSNILGRLGMNGSSNDLFLINPNGIFFGANSSLDISGTFTAGTATGINFSDGSQFSAIKPGDPVLLSIATPTGLQRPVYLAKPVTVGGKLSASGEIQLEGGELTILNSGEINSPDYDISLLSYAGRINVAGSVTAKKIKLSSENDINISGNLNVLNNYSSVDVNSYNGTINVSGSIAGPKINLDAGENLNITGFLNNFLNMSSQNATYLRSRLGSISINRNMTGNKITLDSGKDVLITGSLTTTPPVDYYNIYESGDILISAKGNILIRQGKLDTSEYFTGSGNILINGGNINLEDSYFDSSGQNGNSEGLFQINSSGSVSIKDSSIYVKHEVINKPDTTNHRISIISDSTLIDNSSVVLKPSGYFKYISRGEDNSYPTINLNSKKSIILTNASRLDSSSSFGNSGDIVITSPNLYILNYSQINASFLSSLTSKGRSGFIGVDSDNIFISSGSSITNDSSIVGKFKDQDINAMLENTGLIRIRGFNQEFVNNLNISGDGSRISSQVIDANASQEDPLSYVNLYTFNQIVSGEQYPVTIGGEISISSRNISLSDKASIKVGNDYSGTLYFGFQNSEQGYSPSGSIGNLLELCRCQPLDKAGLIKIASDSLSLSDQSSIVASATNGSGGNISIVGRDAQLAISENSKISAATVTGSGGNILLNGLRALDMSQNSSISVSVRDGKSGDIRIDAKDRIAINSGGIFSTATGTGSSGNLSIATDRLSIENQGQLTVSSQGSGIAGNLSVTANSLNLNSGKLVAETANGQGGNMQINSRDWIIMKRNSLISTTAGSGSSLGDGGKISIITPFLIGTPNGNSDIVANAFSGSGGEISIASEGTLYMIYRSRDQLKTLLGTNDPNKLNPSALETNDITAISQVNPNLNGLVTVNALNLDPGRGLSADAIAPANPQIVQDCRAQTQSSGNKFTNSGRGGTPPDTNSALSGSILWQDDRFPVAISSSPKLSPVTTIPEAQGWKRGPNNTIIFTKINADNSTNLSSIASRPCYAN